jgi:DNA-binding transcriptional regulator YhcF (GntR family)
MILFPNAALQRQRELTGSEWKVFSQLIAHRNMRTGRCEVSRDRLAEETGLNVSTVSESLTSLARQEWIRRGDERNIELIIGADEFARVQERLSGR